MGAHSRAEHLKPKVRRRIREGASLADLRREFPQVPRSTMQLWYKTMSHQNPESPRLYLVDPLREDLNWLKAVLKKEVEQPTESSGARVQAANAMIRCIELEARLFPKTVRQFAEMLAAANISPQEFMADLVAAHQRQSALQQVNQ